MARTYVRTLDTRVYLHVLAMSFGCARGVARSRMIAMSAIDMAYFHGIVSIYVLYRCGKACGIAARTMQSLEGLWFKTKCPPIQISTSITSSS